MIPTQGLDTKTSSHEQVSYVYNFLFLRQSLQAVHFLKKETSQFLFVSYVWVFFLCIMCTWCCLRREEHV